MTPVSVSENAADRFAQLDAWPTLGIKDLSKELTPPPSPRSAPASPRPATPSIVAAGSLSAASSPSRNKWTPLKVEVKFNGEEQKVREKKAKKSSPKRSTANSAASSGSKSTDNKKDPAIKSVASSVVSLDSVEANAIEHVKATLSPDMAVSVTAFEVEADAITTVASAAEKDASPCANSTSPSSAISPCASASADEKDACPSAYSTATSLESAATSDPVAAVASKERAEKPVAEKTAELVALMSSSSSRATAAAKSSAQPSATPVPAAAVSASLGKQFKRHAPYTNNNATTASTQAASTSAPSHHQNSHHHSNSISSNTSNISFKANRSTQPRSHNHQNKQKRPYNNNNNSATGTAPAAQQPAHLHSNMNQYYTQSNPAFFADLETLRYWIKAQIEYYFSIENLCKDLWFRGKMDENGYVFLFFFVYVLPQRLVPFR